MTVKLGSIQIVFTLFLLFGNLVFGNEVIRPRTLDDFQNKRLQAHYPVPNARIAWANYNRLRSDFPQLRTLNEDQIDQWILRNFALVSELQLNLRGIRISDFSVENQQPRTFAHPHGYYRAAVAPANAPNETNEGVVDLKGSGSSNNSEVADQVREFQRIQALPAGEERVRAINALRTRDHSDGMMSLGEAIAEVSRQMAIQESFDIYNHEHGTDFQTVENYFIIDLGIDVLKDNGATIPAGIIGRQGHWRGSSELRVPSTIYTDDYGRFQSSTFDSSVDFGGVIITQQNLQNTFGVVAADSRVDPQESRPWRYGHETATYFRQVVRNDYRAARHAINEHLATMLAPVKQQHRNLAPINERTEYINYLVSRLEVRDQSSRTIVVEKFLSLDIQKILPHIDRIFRLELPRTVVGPILQALLTDGRLSRNSAEYRRIHRLGLRYRYSIDGSAGVTAPALEALRDSRDLRSLAYIIRAQNHPDSNIRAKAVELFLLRDINQIVRNIDRVFQNTENPRSVIGPVVSRLLTDGRLQAGSPEFESILTRALEFKSQPAVIIPALNIISQRNDARTQNILRDVFNTTNDREVQNRIAQIVVGLETSAALSFTDSFFTHGTADSVNTFADALLSHDRIPRDSPEYQTLLSKVFEFSQRGIGNGATTLIFLQATNGITNSENLEHIRTILNQNWNREIKAKAVEDLFQWDIQTVLSFLDFMIGNRTTYNPATDRYISRLVRDSRLPADNLNALIERGFTLTTDGTSAWILYPMFSWLVTSGRAIPIEYILRAMADPHDDLRKKAVEVFLQRDIEEIWSHLDQALQLDFPQTVRGTILRTLLADNRIPANSDRHYQILDKARQFSNRESQYVYNPMLEFVATDTDSRVRDFVMFCLTHKNEGVRAAAVRALLRRNLPEIMTQLDAVFRSGMPRTVIAPVIRGLLESRISREAEEYYVIIDRALSYDGEHPEYVIEQGLNAMRSDSTPTGESHLLLALHNAPARTGIINLLMSRSFDEVRNVLPEILKLDQSGHGGDGNSSQNTTLRALVRNALQRRLSAQGISDKDRQQLEALMPRDEQGATVDCPSLLVP